MDLVEGNMTHPNRPFKAKHLGRCGKCHDYIYDGEMIVRLEEPESWLVRERLIPVSYTHLTLPTTPYV